MNRTRTNKDAPKGVALLMVLAIIMAITVLSLGFLARTETELACGYNMGLRVQMDQMATSGLEHARGLILYPPQGTPAPGYWTGANALQLDASSKDFYDVNVVGDAGDHCNYLVTCDAYRLENAEKIGRSMMSAQLRVDPCITVWLGTATAMPQATVVKGDLYCGGDLDNQGTVEGDVFAAGSITGVSPEGRANAAVATPPVAWPGITVADYNPTYQVDETSYSPTIIASSTPSGVYGPSPSNPGGVCYRHGDTTISGNITITGLLVVNGDLTIANSGDGVNRITAVPGFPALLVSGDLIVEPVGRLSVEGLAVVEGKALIAANFGTVDVTGGMLVDDGYWEITQDASGNGLTGTVHGAPTWTTGQADGALKLDGVDDYVDCGKDASLAITNEITVAAWVKTDEVGTAEHGPFVTKGDRTYALKHGLNSIAFFIYDPVAKWQPATHAVNSSFNGQWHHVAGTYDGNDVKLYVDGQEKNSAPFVGSINNLDYPLNIGRNAQEADRFYSGAIDEVRVYSRALEPAEILQLHADPAALGDPTGLKVRYQFNAAGADVDIIANPAATAMVVWDWDAGDMEWKGQHWGTGVDAFFRSVQRQ